MPGLAEDRPSILGCENSLGIGLVHDVGCEMAASQSSCAVSPNSLRKSLPSDEDLLRSGRVKVKTWILFWVLWMAETQFGKARLTHSDLFVQCLDGNFIFADLLY